MNLQTLEAKISIQPCGTIQITGPNGTAKLVPEDVVSFVNRPGLVNLMLAPMFLKPVDPIVLQRRIGELVFRVCDPEAGPILDGKTDPATKIDSELDWENLDDLFL